MVIYKNVFERGEFTTKFSLEDFLVNQEDIANHFGVDASVWERIPLIKDKSKRNQFKRDNLPACAPAEVGVMPFDIDSIRGKDVDRAFDKIFSEERNVYAFQKSVSGGLVVYYKFDCSVEDFSFVYYKKYLELTLLLGVNIDFLPDLSRLRYLSMGTLYLNKDAKPLTEALRVGVLPVINANVSPTGARRVIYGSR